MLAQLLDIWLEKVSTVDWLENLVQVAQVTVRLLDRLLSVRFVFLRREQQNSNFYCLPFAVST